MQGLGGRIVLRRPIALLGTLRQPGGSKKARRPQKEAPSKCSGQFGMKWEPQEQGLISAPAEEVASASTNYVGAVDTPVISDVRANISDGQGSSDPSRPQDPKGIDRFAADTPWTPPTKPVGENWPVNWNSPGSTSSKLNR
jgi:hypothetical protein